MTNTPDGPLLQACEDFFKLNKRWIDANQKYNSFGDVCLDAEDLRHLTRCRHDDLKELVSLSASTREGLLAKQNVLQELLSLEEPESPRIIGWVLALLEDYNNFVMGERTYQPRGIETLLEEGGRKPQDEKKFRRLSLHNIFAFLHN